MRYWIHDRERSRQAFPLRVRVQRVNRVAGGPGSRWVVHRARGHGAGIQAWHAELAGGQELEVSLQRLGQLTQGNEHWFCDLDAECISATLRVRFGLHDGAALFVEAPVAAARQVAASFKDIHPSW